MKIELDELDWSNKIQRMNKAENTVREIETIVDEFDVMDATKIKCIAHIISRYNREVETT